ncbi:hypothetical protein CPB84DRAFT_1810124 [Gymnopilus junonius]|uniref:Uncharacterized protein n=1 Tax=Gymnopilus junonius TaxID=109634 RepID=A0A9P5TEC6_GYMJU|nr:hypothetical protein CPB84DRAFT_1810124 [Gymnopilus junonius]
MEVKWVNYYLHGSSGIKGKKECRSQVPAQGCVLRQVYVLLNQGSEVAASKCATVRNIRAHDTNRVVKGTPLKEFAGHRNTTRYEGGRLHCPFYRGNRIKEGAKELTGCQPRQPQRRYRYRHPNPSLASPQHSWSTLRGGSCRRRSPFEDGWVMCRPGWYLAYQRKGLKIEDESGKR